MGDFIKSIFSPELVIAIEGTIEELNSLKELVIEKIKERYF